MIGTVKVHAGREALRRFRPGKELRKKMSKRNDKVTRTGWRYRLTVWDQTGHASTEEVTISRRNDKAVIDSFLRYSYVKRVQIRSLSKCVYAMAPDNYYAHSDIISMESVYI